MLVMSKGALTAAKAESYYEEKYSQDDYYSEQQRSSANGSEMALRSWACPERLRPKTSASCSAGFALPPARYLFTKRTATMTGELAGTPPSTHRSL